MHIRSIANQLSNAVSLNRPVTLLKSAGYTIGAGQRQIPVYASPITGWGQIQALDSSDLQHDADLNIQSSIRALYVYGPLAGAIRPNDQGGDLVEINGQTWLVVKVLETWPAWTKVMIVLQEPS